jgi:predicted transposase YbfD/YdcC
MKKNKLREKLEEVPDPRRRYGNLRHKLWEILIIALLSVICLGEDYDDMEEFGKEREGWLKEELGLELKNGVADGDTFKRVISRIKPQHLRAKLNESLDYIREIRDIINIDGKTKRSSGCNSKGKHPIHIISAFASENQLVLGEVKSGNKKTEIKEIPKLLDIIDVSGSIVTIDAIGCQHEIVEKIIDEKADYVIGLKKNQLTLYEAVNDHFMYEPSMYETVYTEEKNGSRVEKREYYLERDLSWLPQKDEWKGLESVGMTKSVIERDGKVNFEIKYHATSLTDVNEYAESVRKHWGIENKLHWCLDVVYREDKAKGNQENGGLNMNILVKHALHLIGKADLSGHRKMGKESKKRKRFKATLNPDVLLSMVLCPQ